MEESSKSPMAVAKRLWFKSLIDHLLENGLTKTQIAEEINVSPQRLTNILNGSDSVSDKVIDSFVSAYDLGDIKIISQKSPSINGKQALDIQERMIDRLERYLLLRGISEQQAIVNARLNGDFWQKIKEEHRDLSSSEAKAFLKVFVDLSEEWLMTGEGEMLNANSLPIANRKQPMARILELLDEEGISLEEFAQTVNSKVVIFNNAIKWPFDSMHLILGNDKQIRGWVEAFCQVFPKYSRYWIMTGKTSKYNYPINTE